jgi:hypothetical protein
LTAILADRIEPSELEGASVLIGITRELGDGTHELEQYHGTASFEDQGDYGLVIVQCSDGTDRQYPFDSRSLERAAPGEYRLRSTGEVVADPDFLMTWIVSKDED